MRSRLVSTWPHLARGVALTLILAAAVLGVLALPRTAAAVAPIVAARNAADGTRCVLGSYGSPSGSSHGIAKCIMDGVQTNPAKMAALAGTTVNQITSGDSKRGAWINARALVSGGGAWQAGSVAHCPNPTGTVGTRIYFGPQTNPTVGVIPANAFVYVCEVAGPPSGVYLGAQIAYGTRGSPTLTQSAINVCPVGWTNTQCDSGGGATYANPVMTYQAWDGIPGATTAKEWMEESMEIPEAYSSAQFPTGTPCSDWGIYVDTADQNVGVLPGDFVQAWSSAADGTVGEQYQPPFENWVALTYRIGPDDPWKPLRPSPPVGTEHPGEREWRALNTGTSILYAQQVEFACTDTNANGGQTYYWNALGDQRDEPYGNLPCLGLTWYWPEQQTYQPGEPAVLPFKFRAPPNGGYDGEIDAMSMWLKRDVEGEFTDPALYTFPIPEEVVPGVVTIHLEDLEGTPLDYPLAPGVEGEVRWVIPGEPGDASPWNINDMEIICEDTEGRTRRYPGGEGVPGDGGVMAGKLPTTPEGRSLSKCANTDGIGWAPSSWLRFAILKTGCVAEYVFIPSQSAIDGISGTYEDSAAADLFAPVVATATGFSGLASITGTCEGTPVDLPLGDGHTEPVNFLAACDGPSSTARNVSYWVSRLTVMLAFGYFLRRTAMGLVGAAEEHYGTF